MTSLILNLSKKIEGDAVGYQKTWSSALFEVSSGNRGQILRADGKGLLSGIEIRGSAVQFRKFDKLKTDAAKNRFLWNALFDAAGVDSVISVLNLISRRANLTGRNDIRQELRVLMMHQYVPA